MATATIFQIVVTALLWIATFIFLLGYGKILGLGLAVAPLLEEEGREEEIKVQGKYIALRLLLPLSIIFTVLTVGEIIEAPWWQYLVATPWLGILSFVILFGYAFFIVTRINNGKYKGQGRGK
ncbi:MAG: hypothetical protein FWB75_04880 [Oscillospiraceae bacterium]|nr:hypothetical protein [Oscillospiraceae bacterium]